MYVIIRTCNTELRSYVYGDFAPSAVVNAFFLIFPILPGPKDPEHTTHCIVLSP